MEFLADYREEIEKMLLTMTPYEIRNELRKYSVSQCKSIGEVYCFLPAFLLPRNTVAYFNGRIYYIFYSTQRLIEQEQALVTLKVIADDTRLKIIDLLSERSVVNGKTIAKVLGIAPSTVSHHMDQLVDCNMIREEKVGNAKNYSINKEYANSFIKELQGILLKNE